jgi:hypothetical protein
MQALTRVEQAALGCLSGQSSAAFRVRSVLRFRLDARQLRGNREPSIGDVARQ